MKILTILFATLLISPAAMAEHIYCSFTEPFINITYNSDTNKAVVSTPESGEQEVVVEVIFNEQVTLLSTSIAQKSPLLGE